MFDLLLLSALIAGAKLVTAQNGGSPCQQVGEAQASFAAAYPQASFAYVSADLAEACLKSVPIDNNENTQLISEIIYYLHWQSNLAYLVDPPDGYTEDRVNIEDSIQKIYDKVQAKGYSNEWDFQVDLANAFNEAYDFHFQWTPDIFGIFNFQRGNLVGGDEFGMVSVSSDGNALPELYNWCMCNFSSRSRFPPCLGIVTQ
jgi:hypothetical protein